MDKNLAQYFERNITKNQYINMSVQVHWLDFIGFLENYAGLVFETMSSHLSNATHGVLDNFKHLSLNKKYEEDTDRRKEGIQYVLLRI